MIGIAPVAPAIILVGSMGAHIVVTYWNSAKLTLFPMGVCFSKKIEPPSRLFGGLICTLRPKTSGEGGGEDADESEDMSGNGRGEVEVEGEGEGKIEESLGK